MRQRGVNLPGVPPCLYHTAVRGFSDGSLQSERALAAALGVRTANKSYAAARGRYFRGSSGRLRLGPDAFRLNGSDPATAVTYLDFYDVVVETFDRDALRTLPALKVVLLASLARTHPGGRRPPASPTAQTLLLNNQLLDNSELRFLPEGLFRHTRQLQRLGCARVLSGIDAGAHLPCRAELYGQRIRFFPPFLLHPLRQLKELEVPNPPPGLRSSGFFQSKPRGTPAGVVACTDGGPHQCRVNLTRRLCAL
jgi:hypothetical protein